MFIDLFSLKADSPLKRVSVKCDDLRPQTAERLTENTFSCHTQQSVSIFFFITLRKEDVCVAAVNTQQTHLHVFSYTHTWKCFHRLSSFYQLACCLLRLRPVYIEKRMRWKQLFTLIQLAVFSCVWFLKMSERFKGTFIEVVSQTERRTNETETFHL